MLWRDDFAAMYPDLSFDRHASAVLRITLDGPGLNSVDHEMHRQLADVWLSVDRDPETHVAVLQGAGRAFSAGGSFELLDDIMSDFAVRTRVMREARPDVGVVPRRDAYEMTSSASARTARLT
jgi:enoyl-CoA hydratase